LSRRRRFRRALKKQIHHEQNSHRENQKSER
jgi:hypothetical protein